MATEISPFGEPSPEARRAASQFIDSVGFAEFIIRCEYRMFVRFKGSESAAEREQVHAMIKALGELSRELRVMANAEEIAQEMKDG